jgi:pimeloyl-ACP methyl ester carboxylesterase
MLRLAARIVPAPPLKETIMPTVHVLSRAKPGRETLICLHASGSTGRQWAPLAAALSSRFAVATPDLLGYGSPQRWPSGAPTSLDAEARALAPLMSRGPVHLFGHSYGGAVALQLALRWPDRVLSLTLYEPVRFALLRRDPATAAASQAIVGVGRRVGMEVLSGTLHLAAQRFVDYWSGDGSWQTLAPRRQQLLAERMPKVQAEFEALFADPVPAAAYRALAMPVHLIGGSRSPLPARQVSEVLARHLPQATRTVLAGLGHMGPVEAPPRVLAAFEAGSPAATWRRAA